MTDIFLMPGELAVIAEPGTIRTVLGSCVAVILYDKLSGVGGVNHFLLPASTGVGEAHQLKYASPSTLSLIYEVLEMGGMYENLQAEVYGGGAVVEVFSSMFSIGNANIRAAREILAKWRIPIVKEDVGGKRGRKIRFTHPDFSTIVSAIAP